MEVPQLSGLMQATLRLRRIENLETFCRDSGEVIELFAKLPRSRIAVKDLISLKYRMQQWRKKVLELVLAHASSSGLSSDAFRLLQNLGLRPNRNQLGLLAAVGGRDCKGAASEYFASVHAHDFLEKTGAVSDHLARIAGPKRKLPIEANAPSRCTFEKWAKMPELSRYQFVSDAEGEGVHYGNILFRPGDVLISNVNRDGNGVYTALIEPRTYAYHLGVFAILEHEGRKLPAVLETYKLGVRAVPLCSFLDPSFSSYLEVVRLKDRPADFCTRANRAAKELPQRVKGYNFDTEDPDRSYVACTTIGTYLFELAGGGKIQAKAGYPQEPRIQRNLAKFDFVLPSFLSLTDYLTDEKMQWVGVVDNGHFENNLTRELCERQFVGVFGRGELDLSKAPLMFHLNRFGVKHMKAGTVLGKLIGAPYGFNDVNFPKGPDNVLAVIEIYEHMIAAAVKKARPEVQRTIEEGALIDVDTLGESPAIRKIFEKPLAPIAKAFIADERWAE